jgi:hypothetical protein
MPEWRHAAPAYVPKTVCRGRPKMDIFRNTADFFELAGKATFNNIGRKPTVIHSCSS